MKIIRTHETDPESLSEFEREQCYNGLDCCVTHDVFAETFPQLDNHTSATYRFSKALQGPVLEMRCRGVLIDQARKAEVIDEFYDQIDILERQLERILFEGVGLESFNWRSPRDLQWLFYEVFEIPPIRKQGRPTCDRNAREKIAAYPIAKLIIDYINTLTELGDKISVLKTGIDADGRIRTSYNIAGTSTGRFSSSLSEFGTGGNLQNIEESLRSIFIANRGFKFAKCDAKSGESFCVGAIEWNLFRDSLYLDACESGDPHTAVARICWPNLGWTGDLHKDKGIAEQPFYRHYSYRFMCKKLGHGCLTPDHEVLTPNGWVTITDKPPSIMAWSETCSEFQPVEQWADFGYTGQLQSFEGNSISLLCTSDHRIPYKKDLRYNLHCSTAENGPQSRMPLGEGWHGGDIEVQARLIAAYMADGSLDKYNITFHFAKERKIQRLLELLRDEDIQYKVYRNSNGTTKISIPKLNWPKRPGPFMFDWTQECIEDFIDEIKWWDGYIGPTSVSITSKYREDLEWLQTFARLIGFGGQIQKPQESGFGTIMYKLQQNNRRWATGSSIQWSQIDVENERVLCPTVPTSWFYVRRNGKIFVTGNSNYGGQPATLAQQSKLPIRVVKDFQPKYFGAFPAHQIWQRWVEDQLRRFGHLTSLTGRKRWFFGRRNDPATLREAIAYDPQCSLADIVNTAMLNIWRERTAIIVMHDHDALTFMYPEEQEDEIIPKLLDQLIVPIQLKHGRELRIPYDVEVGWNKGKYDKDKNPNGLKAYGGHDDRKREEQPGILDRKISRAKVRFKL